jgi:hypothetical protein
MLSGASADGPVVEGVKSCTISDGHGGFIELACPWDKVCCAVPVYAIQGCPNPPGPTCLVYLDYTCCDPLEGCWDQFIDNKPMIWCGEPFPPI